MLVITDHETINSVLRDRPDGFRRTSRLRAAGLELNSKPGVSSAEGESWRNQRRLVMASFSAANIRAYFPQLIGVTRRLHGRWQTAARNGRAVDLHADLKRYTMDAIIGLAFGTDLSEVESQDAVIIDYLETILAGVYRRMVSPVRYWRYLRLPADHRLERSMAALQSTVERIVLQARDRMHREPGLYQDPTNMLEAMISAAHRDDTGLTEADVAGNVATMLFAGEESTASTLAWMIYLLARHPDALRRAQEEVRRIAPDPALFTFDQMETLKFLEACANEAMRLKPVLPFNAVEALHDTAVAGIHVPAGTLVWCVMRHDSVSERYFRDPTRFEPMRWLGEVAAGPWAGSVRRASMPFGSGPRICPGRYLAMLEIKMAVAMLLGSFEIEAVDTPGGGEARERMSFMMHPVGLRMRLREYLRDRPLTA